MLFNRPYVPVPAPLAAAVKASMAASPISGDLTPAPNVSAYPQVFDPAFCGSKPVWFSQSAPIGDEIESIVPSHSVVIAKAIDVETMARAAVLPMGESTPLPEPRPLFGTPLSHVPLQTPGRRMAGLTPRASGASAPGDHRSFFEKLFGLARSPEPALAYSAPESNLVSQRKSTLGVAPRYDRFTAVYDVAAHTVYMPDGSRLEAHSGLGNMLDDPRYVNERNRGATPPNLYELEPREQLFHGVQALRLKPVGGGGIYGRTGLLAHTYMLGPNGDSNGCVSFRNYKAFLQAYQNGAIRHLVVVARQS